MEVENKTEWDSLNRIPLKNETFICQDQVGTLLQNKYRKIKFRERSVFVLTRTLAASFVLGLIGCSVYFASNVRIETELCKSDVELPDGSRVELNAESQLRYNRLSWVFERTTHLTGSARFVVRKGSKFTVATEHADVSVLGTIFSVTETKDGVEVACEEGHVRVSSILGRKELHGGESLDVRTDTLVFHPTLDEFCSFREISLTMLAAKLKEFYDKQVVVSEEVKDYQFTGLIPTRNLQEAMDILSSSCEIKCRIEGDSLYLSK